MQSECLNGSRVFVEEASNSELRQGTFGLRAKSVAYCKRGIGEPFTTPCQLRNGISFQPMTATNESRSEKSSHRKKNYLCLPGSVLCIDNAVFSLMSKECERRLRVAWRPKIKEIGVWGYVQRGVMPDCWHRPLVLFLCMKDSIVFQENYGIITVIVTREHNTV